MTRWWLDDAEAKHAAAPSSFFIPPADKRRSLVPGDMVKLVFAFEPAVDGWAAERMWVKVTAVRGGAYVGALANTPRYIESLQAGSVVEFEPRHVAAYDWPAEELGYDASLHAWVSKKVFGAGEQPLIATRRPAEGIAEESDSGWTVGSGDEPDAGPAHFEWSPVGWLTDRFPELEAVFRAGDGDWRWDPVEGQYFRV